MAFLLSKNYFLKPFHFKRHSPIFAAPISSLENSLVAKRGIWETK